MKSLLVLLMFFSSFAYAATEVAHCDAQFIFPDEQNQLTVTQATMVISSENGKETATVTYQGQLIYSGDVGRQSFTQPQLEMIEQIRDMSAEDANYAALAKQIYGTTIDDILKNATRSDMAMVDSDDDGGAMLMQHFDASGKLISTELDIAWLGAGLCK